MKNNAPCYGCETRKDGCHSDCEKYEEWKSQRKKEQQEIKKQNQIDYTIRRVHYQACMSRRKKG